MTKLEELKAVVDAAGAAAYAAADTAYQAELKKNRRRLMIDNRKLHPTTRTIWQLSNEGLRAGEIEAATGVDKKSVIMTICRGRKSGDCTPRVKTLDAVFRKSPLTWGSMKQVKAALSVDQAQWLFDEAEKCGCKTVAEYVSEIVLDAHEEAQTKKNTNQIT
jgi:hypothetical protein|tara:strand:- start:825 stop:1310 length:486 start_codon:yes stop_codon:yes gene_type:complete